MEEEEEQEEQEQEERGGGKEEGRIARKAEGQRGKPRMGGGLSKR